MSSFWNAVGAFEFFSNVVQQGALVTGKQQDYDHNLCLTFPHRRPQRTQIELLCSVNICNNCRRDRSFSCWRIVLLCTTRKFANILVTLMRTITFDSSVLGLVWFKHELCFSSRMTLPNNCWNFVRLTSKIMAVVTLCKQGTFCTYQQNVFLNLSATVPSILKQGHNYV